MAKKNFPETLPDNIIPYFRMNNADVHLHDHLAYFFVDHYPMYMHRHDFYELNIVVNGTGAHYIENNRYPIKKGDVFVLPPQIRHGYWQTSEHMSIFHLLIERSLLNSNYFDLRKFPGYKTLFQTEPQLRTNKQFPALFLHLTKEQFDQTHIKMKELVSLSQQYATVPPALFNIHAVSLICDLSYYIYKRNETFVKNNALDNDYYKMQLSVEFIESNYAQPLTVKELAKNMFISESTYMRYFKRLFNQTPMQYIINVRIEKAISKLTDTDDSIAQIAQDCGFFDSSHFSNTFFSVVGRTPTQYRNENTRK